VWAAALGFVGYGLYQLYRAYAAKLSKKLDLGRLSSETGRLVIGVSRAGIAARGVVFGVTGVILARAASRDDASQRSGVGGALEALGDFGRIPLVVIALGLVAYGCTSC
jgi:hypothetical protein